MILGPELDQLLRELEIGGQRNDAQEKDRRKKFLNLERPIFDPMATVVVVEFEGAAVEPIK